MSNIKHGMHNTPTWNSWRSMRKRCLDPNATGYERYGGRGVSICPRWEEFSNFLADMGTRPHGKTLDRIDPHGNYEPSNCRWATPKEQASNTKRGPGRVYKNGNRWAVRFQAKENSEYRSFKTKLEAIEYRKHRGAQHD